MISLKQKFTISSEVLAQEIDEETVLLDLKSDSYFGLDEVGTRIWQLLKETGDLQAVFDTMIEEYDVDDKQLKKDLLDHLTQLVEAGLVSLVSTKK